MLAAILLHGLLHIAGLQIVKQAGIWKVLTANTAKLMAAAVYNGIAMRTACLNARRGKALLAEA
jgi:hypothetical protein